MLVKQGTHYKLLHVWRWKLLWALRNILVDCFSRLIYSIFSRLQVPNRRYCCRWTIRVFSKPKEFANITECLLLKKEPTESKTKRFRSNCITFPWRTSWRKGYACSAKSKADVTENFTPRKKLLTALKFSSKKDYRSNNFLEKYDSRFEIVTARYFL